jgi:hypothetical protein
MKSSIQSILIPKNLFTLEQAKNWMKKNNFPILKVHETNKYYRFRQQTPETFNKYYTKKIKNEIELIIGLY